MAWAGWLKAGKMAVAFADRMLQILGFAAGLTTTN